MNPDLPESSDSNPINPPPPAALDTTTEEPGKGSGTSLVKEVQLLKSLVMLMLAGMLILSFGLNFHLYWQLRQRSKELDVQKPTIDRMVMEFENVSRPKIDQFLNELRQFAVTHPDFTPILDKHLGAPPAPTNAMEKFQTPTLPPTQLPEGNP